MSQNPTPALARRMANAVRMLAVDAVEKAKSGHPHWMERDRFVRSNGHGSMPCSNLVDRQPPAYQDAVLAPQLPAAALPAAQLAAAN